MPEPRYSSSLHCSSKWLSVPEGISEASAVGSIELLPERHVEEGRMTEATAQKILGRLGAIEAKFNRVFGGSFLLDGRFLTLGNLNDATARAAKQEFDRLIGG